jgi:hypothetical protein
MIVNPRYDRLPIDREFHLIGMVEWHFGEYSTAGTSLDQELAAQVRVLGESDDGFPM